MNMITKSIWTESIYIFVQSTEYHDGKTNIVHHVQVHTINSLYHLSLPKPVLYVFLLISSRIIIKQFLPLNMFRLHLALGFSLNLTSLFLIN